MTIERITDVPGKLRRLGTCLCLTNIGWAEQDISSPGRSFGLSTGWANAVKDCSVCGGTALDRDRLAGAILRFLNGRITHLGYHPERGWKIAFRHDGQRRYAASADLLEALVAVANVVSTGETPVVFHEFLEAVPGHPYAVQGICGYCTQGRESHLFTSSERGGRR